MDIEPPIKPATDSDDNKSNDSTASQPQHLQEMAKSTVVIKEIVAPVAPNDNASAEIPTSVAPPPEALPISQVEGSKPVEAPSAPLLNPPTVTSIPQAVSAPDPIAQNQEVPIVPPNVTVSQHHQGVGMPPHMPPHGAYPGYPQGPPRAPFYGHIQPYQQGFQQYPPYGHHMPPYPQNPYHAPPPHAGYPVPGAENHNPYPQGPAMHSPIPHQPLQPPVAEEPAEKNGS